MYLKSQRKYTPVKVAEAEELLRNSSNFLTEVEKVVLNESIGRISSEEICSPTNIPAGDTSMVDGFALRSVAFKTTKSFQIECSILAGHPKVELEDGNRAVYVSTGAFMPNGADMVVPIEGCSVSEGQVCISDSFSGLESGSNVRVVGSDTHKGDVIMKKGVQISAAEIAMLNACKVSEIACFKKISVSVLSTGLEVYTGMVADANRPYIINRLGESDFANCIEMGDLGIMKDDEPTFPQLLKDSDFDVLITTGSISKGMTDHFK